MPTIKVDSPLGTLRLFGTDRFLTSVKIMPSDCMRPNQFRDMKNDLLSAAEEQLRLYFIGQIREFTVPIFFAGTSFQKKVWHTISKIPYGETSTYKEIAILSGYSGAARAVGSASAKNLLPIFIPCHRVIKHDGSAGSYSGGKKNKVILLRHETRYSKE